MQLSYLPIPVEDAFLLSRSPGPEGVEINDGPWYLEARACLSMWLARGRKGSGSGGTVGGLDVAAPCEPGRHAAARKG